MAPRTTTATGEIEQMNSIHKAACAVCLGGLIATGAAAQERTIGRAGFSAAIGARQSDFLAVDLGTGERCRLEDSDLATKHAPWSTFKIPNLLIALDTGAASGLDHWRDWDTESRPAAAYWPADWRQGQTLGTAFKRSAVWYFRDIAREVGGAAYRGRLGEWGYGNAAAPDGSDDFWLSGPLAISVAEQVGFIASLVSGELGLAPAHLDALSNVSASGAAGGVTLHGKTGSGPVVPGGFSGGFEGWYVGWLARETAAQVAFAHYARAATYAEIRDFRRGFALELLAACGYLPEGFPP